MSDFIPVCEPVIGEKEENYILEALRTNWISSKGRFVEEFAQKFAEFCGVRYCVLTTSGTTALHLALAALGIGPGDEVIIPAFTMAATAFAVSYTGATPVLVDSEPETGNIDVSKIEEKITPRTRAIIPVHIYGHPCDMDSLIALARKYNLFVIEDAAEAHGAEYRGRRCGSIGDVGCFSFYANKIITMGEGGAVVTNDPQIAEKLRLLSDLAHSPRKRFSHIDLGFNYRLTNLQAAIGLAQLERAEELIEARRRNAQLYNGWLEEIPGLRLPIEKRQHKNVYWMYGVVVEQEFGMDRDKLMEALRQRGIGTRAFFVPMHQQPIYRKKLRLFRDEKYPVAEELGRKGLYLPSGSGLTRDQIEYICTVIKELANG